MPDKKPKTKARKPSQKSPPRVVLEREAVARLAYELYLRRGGQPGFHEEDWLMAEQILREEKERPAPQTQASYAARRLEDKFKK